MIRPRKIELLAPAKNLKCGIEAIRHGADAVYIGAPRFGARAGAANSLEEIAELVAFAHLYFARVYVTVNTILSDEELEEAGELIWGLYRIGVDALIIQDMGICWLDLPPIPLHASTQMDNRTVEKVRFLADAGFRQVVLARELSLEEISRIHEAVPDVSLEVFVHGALCVSYSGQCYVSEACFKRSANRGECAQFCRLPFTLEDADGRVIAKDKHLLSLKDMNRLERLEELLDAGVTSLKIEGRLKEVSYVKNITAAYRRKLDQIFAARPAYARASSGSCRLFFTPQPEKSFNRGFTDYLWEKRSPEIVSFDTPKSLGEEMGRVKEVRGNHFTVAGIKPFNNGDGVCYLDSQGKLQGFRVNRVEENRLYPLEPVDIPPKTLLYRNYDQAFESLLSKESAERKIGVTVLLAENRRGFSLTMTDEDRVSVTHLLACDKEAAKSPQGENITKQLSKMGDTPFRVEELRLDLSRDWFIPSSQLAELRRQTVAGLLRARRINRPSAPVRIAPSQHAYPALTLSYLGNVMNEKAASFYLDHGVGSIAPAYEKQRAEDAILMLCKHCLRYSMGGCARYGKGTFPYQEPLSLVTTAGKRFRLTFDCKNCQMRVSES